jgi:hypothetical protein
VILMMWRKAQHHPQPEKRTREEKIKKSPAGLSDSMLEVRRAVSVRVDRATEYCPSKPSSPAPTATESVGANRGS